MADIEKVIKGLEYCIADAYCDDCPYTDDCFEIDDKPYGEQLMRDALALLKEKEDVKPFHKCIGKEYTLIEDSAFDYCPYCGKKIFWE